MLTGWNAKHTLAAIAMLLVFGLVLVFALNRGGDDDATEATPTPTPRSLQRTCSRPPCVISPPRTKTAKGIGVGSSLGALRSAYGDQLSPAVDAGFDQAGVYLAEDDQWLGFLFDTKRDAITDNSKITFMEVTRGEKPALIRDGC